jgi:phage-related baseplate assembly protein
VIIPIGTRATGDFVLYFKTDAAAIIPAGELYVDVKASSVEGGTIYNGLAPGTINTIVDLVPYVDKVENITTTSGGSDREEDDSLRERIKLSPVISSTAGPVEAYKYWAKTADPNISDVAVVSPSPGEVEIVPILLGGELPDEGVLQKVLEVVNADDVRPLTDHVTVRAPDTIEYDIELKYYTTAADESKAIETIEGAGGAISRYINWQGSALGRDINPDQLRKLILAPSWDNSNLVGAIRVDIISPVYTPVPATSVAKFSGNLIVTHEVVEE